MIESTGETYAETLKKLKEGLKTEEVAVVENARKTRSGKVLLKVSRDIDNLKTKIQNIMQDSKVRTQRPKSKILHIKGIDPTVETEEIKTAIQNAGIKYIERCEVKSLRPTGDANQACTVVLDKSDGEKILKLKRLKIGFSICTVKERVNLLQCYRCWNYGHKATDCKEKDRSNLCRRCAKGGHKAKDCNGQPYCPICEIAGHATGSGNCPKFRKELNIKQQLTKDTHPKHTLHTENDTHNPSN
jgi:hypothetical protein